VSEGERQTGSLLRKDARANGEAAERLMALPPGQDV